MPFFLARYKVEKLRNKISKEKIYLFNFSRTFCFFTKAELHLGDESGY